MSIKIALAGNPNCGKTTLFNNLTAGSVLLGRCASQCFRNEMPDGLRP